MMQLLFREMSLQLQELRLKAAEEQQDEEGKDNEEQLLYLEIDDNVVVTPTNIAMTPTSSVSNKS